MLLWGLLAGIAFGYILHRAGALEYDNILKMLRLLDLRIMQFMFFAVAVSLVGIYTLNVFSVGTINNLPFHPGVVVGGLVFGVGFALTGYCPGTVIGALGQGKKDAIFVTLGAFLGTFLYAFAHKPLKAVLIDNSNFGNLSFDKLLGMSPAITAFLFAGLIAVGMFLVGRLVPTRQDKKMSPPSV
jgi:uncharacterized membrane protein YedE/YeeE